MKKSAESKTEEAVKAPEEKPAEQTPEQKKIEAMRNVLIFLRDDCVSGNSKTVEMINRVI